MTPFTNQKLHVAVRILLYGMLAGLAYHAFQSRILGQVYPYDTFLYLPYERFSDFYDVLLSAKGWDPYSIWSLYFPFTYVAFHPLSALPWLAVFIGFFTVTFAGLWRCIYLMLRPAKLPGCSALATAVFLLGGAYPVWFCFDRGNIELGLLLLVCGYLLMAQRHRYWASLGFLVPAMCIKLYPAVFLALLCRRGRLKYAIAAGVLFSLATFASLSAFEHTWRQDLGLWQEQLTKFNYHYIVRDRAMGGSANLWNPAKLSILAAAKVKSLMTGQARPSQEAMVQDVETAQDLYSLLMMVLALAVTWHVCVVEREFGRKVVMLGLFMVTAPPGGADYKLVYVSALLAVFIALTSRRRFDVSVVALLSLVLIPKKYWFFPQIITDSGMQDASIGVLLNPLLMLAAAVLLCSDGWRHSTVRGRALRWRHVCMAFAWPSRV